jgi:hypothetical protein
MSITVGLEEGTLHAWTLPFYRLGRERGNAREVRLPVGKGITTLTDPEGSSIP